MIVHVYDRAKQSKTLDSVKLAIDSEITAKELSNFDIDMIMTARSHVSGSDRVGEVVEKLHADIVVNIQGDEPMIDPQIIDDLVGIFKHFNSRMKFMKPIMNFHIGWIFKDIFHPTRFFSTSRKNCDYVINSMIF